MFIPNSMSVGYLNRWVTLATWDVMMSLVPNRNQLWRTQNKLSCRWMQLLDRVSRIYSPCMSVCRRVNTKQVATEPELLFAIGPNHVLSSKHITKSIILDEPYLFSLATWGCAHLASVEDLVHGGTLVGNSAGYPRGGHRSHGTDLTEQVPEVSSAFKN